MKGAKLFLQNAEKKKYAENLISLLLSVYIFVNPFPHTTTIQEICFYGSLLLFVGVNGVRGIKFSGENTPLFLPAILFVVWVVFGKLDAIVAPLPSKVTFKGSASTSFFEPLSNLRQ